jgi:hypothetical protein
MKQAFKKQYIRRGDRTPIGVTVVVTGEDGKRYWGYSICAPVDHFDKKMGTVIALRRASIQEPDKWPLPDVVSRANLVEKNYLEMVKHLA